MTTRRASLRSGARGPEALEVGDDVVDLRRGEGPLERRHERAGLALLDHQPQLLARAALPEGGVAEVPRPGLDGGRRRPVAPALDAVAGRAAGLVDGLPLRVVLAGARLGCRSSLPARGKLPPGRLEEPLGANTERAARRGVQLDARHRLEARPRAPVSQAALTVRRRADTVARWPIRASPKRSRAWWT